MRRDTISRKKSASVSTDREVLFDQLRQIAQGLGETFASFCEVVLKKKWSMPPGPPLAPYLAAAWVGVRVKLRWCFSRKAEKGFLGFG